MMASMSNSSHQSDLATRLLCSSDSKVAAAAKRIFSTPNDGGAVRSVPIRIPVPNGFRSLPDANASLNNTLVQINQGAPEYSSLQQNSSIPSDVKEAASAVIMLAPQQHHISRPNDPVTPTNNVLQPINHLKTMIVPMTVQSITPDHNQSSMEFSSSQDLAKRQNPTDRLKRRYVPHGDKRLNFITSFSFILQFFTRVEVFASGLN